MESIWTKTVEMPEFPTLDKDIRTNVLIIGGGMTGVLCAYFLQQAGIDYCLLEANKICGGITANTTAKITAQQGLIYEKLLGKLGQERAALFLKANETAVKKYKDLGWFVDCDMQEMDSYIYSVHEPRKLEMETQALASLGADVDFVEKTALPFEIKGAVRFRNQAQFHPLKFAAGIAKNLKIYEHSEVREMTEYFALTKEGSVSADKVIIATHFPFIDSRGMYFLKLYQSRSYLMALEHAPDLGGMYLEAEKNGMSFRNYKDYLLVGGGGHRTGKNMCGMEILHENVQQIFPNAKEVCTWAAQDCMSLDGMPYIGNYSKNTQDLYAATGYNKWGMTGSMLAAMVLSDLVMGKENEFSHLFSPSRNMIHTQLFINLWEAVKGIAVPKTSQRCSHMGCVLRWNREEKVWECPCHGSRFDKDGAILDNPATNKLKGKNQE